ncbi:MAG: hypothetical protein ACE5G9_07070 [Nitrospinales bacterium]
MIANRPFKIIFALAVFLLISEGPTASGHEEGAPFSGAIGEPVLVHHAHIEDEQFLNFTFFDNSHTGKEKRAAFANQMEMAIDWTGQFRLGSEIFIPFSNTGMSQGQYELGDIELQAIKYAFINEPERILTGIFSVGLPTGNASRGLGTDETQLGGLLFFDQAYRNWYLGINAEFTSSVSGPTSSNVEAGLALSYSFIRETGEGMAPTLPHQFLVPIVSLEMIAESVLAGNESGTDVVTLLPSFQLWQPSSDWIFLLGVQFPVSTDRENDLAIHFQVGKHFDWGRFFR